jgi:hypothetical protein
LNNGDWMLPSDCVHQSFFTVFEQKYGFISAQLCWLVTFFSSFKFDKLNLYSQILRPRFCLIFICATDDSAVWLLVVCERCSLNLVLMDRRDRRVCPTYLNPQFLVLQVTSYMPDFSLVGCKSKSLVVPNFFISLFMSLTVLAY